VSESVSLSDAKARLAALVQSAEAGQVVHISRHGKQVAVLLSERAFAALSHPSPGQALGKAIDLWRQAGRSGCQEDWPLASDRPSDRSSDRSSDQELSAWRDQASGRAVELP
jgi:prevent-host-death family protein